LYKKYKVGLGINTMQGREAKHVRLQQYAKHASLATRWEVILKRDFVPMFGLEGLTHITLATPNVLTNISQHVSTMTIFAFVGVQRKLIKISARCVPLISTDRSLFQQVWESCLKV